MKKAALKMDFTPDTGEDHFQHIVAAALAEDRGRGDITSELTIPPDLQGEMCFMAREEMIACGITLPGMVFRQLDVSITVQPCAMDGQKVKKNDILAIAKGPARMLLTGERTALNLMQRMSGVATLTSRYVEAVEGTKAVILDTRKTMPGLRALDKYAVRAGGGQNHRMKLDDMVFIKDNHIALSGGIAEAVAKARAGSDLPVEVECDTLDQMRQALAVKPDRILLDNMSVDNLRKAVELAAGKVPLEASGGISLDNVRQIAETGVDYISVGRLTHSAPSLDIGADIKARS